MDSQSYTFNGIGDFTLIRNRTISDVPFEFQGRCEEFSTGVGATVFKAVGGYEGNSGIVEFKANATASKVDFYYNGVKQNMAKITTIFGNGTVVVTVNGTVASAEFQSG